MAGRNTFGSRNQNSGVQSLDVTLEGVVPSSERSGIINDLIKYLLYERGQIPMTYDQMKDLISSDSKKICEKDRRKNTSLNSHELFLHDVDNLFDTVTCVFANIVPIKKILVILGSSIISPKDSFMINFPTEFCEGDLLTHKVCMQKVFRQLIAKKFLDNAKTPDSCSSLFMLFWAPRNCNYQMAKLLPKLSFNAPNRGLRYSINFTFSHVETRSPEISFMNDAVSDISGIELLDDSLGEGHISTSSASYPLSNSTSYVIDTHYQLGTGDKNNHNDDDDDDCIWYQASTVVKGFKEKLKEGDKICQF